MNIFSFSRYKVAIIFFILASILIFAFAIPDTVNAQLKDVPDQLVTCGGTDNPKTAIDESRDCGFCDLFSLAQNIINFLVFFSVILATLLFVYVGFLYLTAGDNPAQISKAKSIVVKVIIGFIVVLSAWLIVDTIMKTFLDTDKPEFGPWNEISC